MSWKSIVTAGVLCVLASPAIADPTLTVTGGRLTRAAANNRRVWNVAVAPDLALSPTGSPLALELAFTAAGGNILSISGAQNAPSRVEHEDDPNGQPGETVFGWEAVVDVGGGNMKPIGTQIGTGANANRAVAFIGTADFTTASRQDLLTITTEANVTALAWGGHYLANGTAAAVGTFANGRIAHVQGASTTNFHNYVGSLNAGSTTAGQEFMGDMDGSGDTNFGDLAAFGQGLQNAAAYATARPHLNRIGRGDANGDGLLNFGDLAGFGQLLQNVPPLGSGSSLEGASVPEPASFVLIALGAGFAVLRRRSR
jgi:PEP-CTERM motif-containing protein